MSGTSGLNTGDFTSVNVAYGIGVGVNDNQGTEGQVLVSGGANQPNTWETIAGGTMEKLNKGTNITMEDTTGASVDFYDGSVETTINSTDTQFENFSAGDGIHFPSGDGTAGNPFVISTDNDGITLTNTGGTDEDQNAVLKVPNALSAGSGITFTPSGTYDGSTARTISLTAQANPNIKISSIGGNSTTATSVVIPASTLNPDGDGGNTLAFTNISGWGITGCEAVSTNYLIDVNFHILQIATGSNFPDSYIRLDRNFNGNTGYSESNNQARPTRVARTIQHATTGLANYKFYITNLVVGDEYGFVPSFYAHQTGTETENFTIGYGGIYGQMTIVATPL